MSDEDLRAALDGLYAYDTGSVDSGIHDEGLRARCLTALEERRARGGWREWLATLVRDMWLSDEAITQGYGVEDAVNFADWLENYMHCPIPA